MGDNDTFSNVYNPIYYLKVSEIFLSIQGEGVEQGNPTIFVRLFGCSLNCTYCDSDFAKKGDYKRMTIEQIADEVDKYLPYYYVQITGGEPLIQENTERLVDELISRNKTIWINTNGSRDVLPYAQKGDRCRLMMDIKTPSSGMTDKMKWSNIRCLRNIDQIIYVIATEEDYIFAKAQSRILGYKCPAQILFSPCFDVKRKFKSQITPAELVEKIKQNKLMVRLSLQLHKILWNPNKRGV